jgi:hypothetical protein
MSRTSRISTSSKRLALAFRTSITAEALLPDGPYNLWREETSRRVGFVGAFAQLPHLPKMLKAQAILTRWPMAASRARSC